MSKRWKTRTRNAAKWERSREVIDKFYGNVISELERIKAMKPEERERLMRLAAHPGNFGPLQSIGVPVQS